MNFAQYLQANNYLQILGFTKEIDADSKDRKAHNFIYLAGIGQYLEQLNGSGAEIREKKEKVIEMISYLIEFYSRYPAMQADPESVLVQNQIIVIYVHSGVGSIQNGGLKIFASAISNQPTIKQKDLVKDIHVIQSTVWLNLRVKRAKFLSLMAQKTGAASWFT